MFDVARFVDDCRSAFAADPSHGAVAPILARAVENPAAVLKALGEPRRAEGVPLHRGDDITIVNIAWGPRMVFMPHNHRTWALIGIYTGREDNIFWRRVSGDSNGKIKAVSAKSIATGEHATLAADVIHSVTNPVSRLTGAIHVYGGDFFAIRRSEWDPETLCEGAYDTDKAMRLFEEANRRA